MPATTDHSFALARRRVRRLLLLLRRHCARTDNHRQPQPRVLKLRAPTKANRVGLTANRAALLLVVVGVLVHRLLVVRAAAAARCSRGRHGGDEPTKTATTHTTSARRHRAQPNTSPRNSTAARNPTAARNRATINPTNQPVRCRSSRLFVCVVVVRFFRVAPPRARTPHFSARAFVPLATASLSHLLVSTSFCARATVGHPPNANAQHSTTDTPRASHSQGRLVPRGARSRSACGGATVVGGASCLWRRPLALLEGCAGVARFGRFVVFVVCGVVVVVVAPAATGSPLRVDVASVADAGSTARVAHCKLCVGEAQRKRSRISNTTNTTNDSQHNDRPRSPSNNTILDDRSGVSLGRRRNDAAAHSKPPFVDFSSALCAATPRMSRESTSTPTTVWAAHFFLSTM